MRRVLLLLLISAFLVGSFAGGTICAEEDETKKTEGERNTRCSSFWIKTPVASYDKT